MRRTTPLMYKYCETVDTNLCADITKTFPSNGNTILNVFYSKGQSGLRSRYSYLAMDWETKKPVRSPTGTNVRSLFHSVQTSSGINGYWGRGGDYHRW